jgi:sugar transferase (PEP-CTERM/EpsH1 system associated)
MTPLDASGAPLVVHLLYRLDCGGLENLLIERINRMASHCYRHAVVCLTGHTAFARRIERPGVALYALDKPPGAAPATHVHLWRLLRRLRPAILHTYNLSALEYAPAALLAGVPVRINGAHGRDAADPLGRNRRHRLLRRLMLPFYDHCYANSADLLAWSRNEIGVPLHKSRLLPNGVDTDRYQPARAAGGDGPLRLHFGSGMLVIGSVGRIEAVKDHANLVRAFALLVARRTDLAPRLRLVIVGDGPLLPALRAQVLAAGLDRCVWLPGGRTDVAELLRELSIFALPSLAEGTPGAALEAMASGVAVVGCAVGGVGEVVADGVTGLLVPAADSQALAAALERYAAAPGLLARHGAAARSRVMRHYAMDAMVTAYQALYDELCARKINLKKRSPSCAE